MKMIEIYQDVSSFEQATEPKFREEDADFGIPPDPKKDDAQIFLRMVGCYRKRRLPECE